MEEEKLSFSEEWLENFQKLLFDNQLDRHESSNLSTDLEDTGGVCEDEILGNSITPKEIQEQISKLRTTKASGMDSILNENKNALSSVESRLLRD